MSFKFLKFETILKVIVVLTCIAIIAPLLEVLYSVLFASSENWTHIQQYLLPDYIRNTLIIIAGTGLCTLTLGISSAYFIHHFDFKFSKFFDIAMILPIAIPSYVLAYVYALMFSYTGIIPKFFTSFLGMQVDYARFDIMNIGGVIFILTCSLFPYIYLSMRSFLKNHSGNLVENAKMLGLTPFQTLYKVIIPVARVAIFGGLVLVLLEVIGDYGVVKYFGVETFATAIFSTWYGLSDVSAALKLSGLLLFFILFFLTIDAIIKSNKRYALTTTKSKPLKKEKLGKTAQFFVLGYLSLIFLLSFGIPLLQMTYYALISLDSIQWTALWSAMVNTLWMGGVTTTIILMLSLLIAHITRFMKPKKHVWITQIINLGYSIPSAIIAISLIKIFIDLDKIINNVYAHLQLPFVSVLTSSLVILIVALLIRYLAAGFNNINAGMSKLTLKYNEAGQTLGFSKTQSFLKIELPQLNHAIIGGAILTFVDVIKELPLTLTLRPANFDSLSTLLFTYANDERVIEGSVIALIIVAISLLATLFLNRTLTKGESLC
ncbi:MAG: ABC transporter permease [Erysipelotrichaceae bacterium]